MKKVSKKIVVGVAALVISIAVATGSTFAWFTTNRDADIDQFEATATTGETNLSVAANVSGEYNRDVVAFRRYVELTNVPVQGDSKATVNKNVLDANADNDPDSHLVALTMDGTDMNPMVIDYVNNITYGTALTYDKLVNADGIVDTTTTANNKYHPFIEFVLHFKGDREMNVYLTSSTVTAHETDGTKPVQAVEYKAANTYGTHEAIAIGDKLASRAANAVRVAFIPVNATWGTDNKVSGAVTFGTPKVWCPNEAEYSGKEATANTTGLGKGNWKGNLAKDYYNGFMRTNKEIIAKEYTSNVRNLLSTDTSESASAATIATLNSANNFTATVVVRIWLEGTDGDCLNSVLTDKFNTYFAFTNDYTHHTVTASAPASAPVTP